MGDRPAEKAAPPAEVPPRATWTRVTVAAVLPPLGASIAQWLFWTAITRWSLFYPAVFLSSWMGGFRAGIGSILISVTLVWTLFYPRSRMSDSRLMFASAVFIIMGYVVCALHRQLRRSMRDSEVALAESQQARQELEGLVTERRIYQALFDGSPDFIGIADATGQPIYINRGGREMVGLPDDLPPSQMRIPELYPESLRSYALDVILKESLETGTWNGETQFRHWRDGRIIPVSQRNFIIRDPRTDQLIGIATITRDISEIQRGREELIATNRRLAETTRELSNNQRLLQGILDFSPNVVVVKDLSGHFLLTNRRFQEILGITEADARGKTATDLFPPAVAERHNAMDAVVLEHKHAVTYEQTIEVSGEARVFLTHKFPLHDEKREPFAICAIWSDITDIKRAEQAVRESEADLLAAERVAHVGSWRWNVKDGSARWSEGLYRIFGRSKSLPVPKLLSEDAHIFTPASLEALRKVMDRLLADGKAYDIDLELARPDGSTRWVAARGEPMRDPKGEIIGVTGTAQDITELKELQRLRDEWTSVIAHDLRQPIGTITMAADLLPEVHAGEMAEPEKVVTGRVRSAARALARMVDDLLDLSLLEANRLSLDKKSVEPRALVEETIAQLAHLTENRHVTVNADRPLPPVSVDPLRIGQVMTNLLSNALKYGDKAGDIEVELIPRRAELEIAVKNHGPGIAAEDLPKIFTRFGRSKASRKSGKRGLGLGLYISKGLVEAHGGRIWVDSTPDTTTFHVALPAAPAAKEVA